MLFCLWRHEFTISFHLHQASSYFSFILLFATSLLSLFKIIHMAHLTWCLACRVATCHLSRPLVPLSALLASGLQMSHLYQEADLTQPALLRKNCMIQSSNKPCWGSTPLNTGTQASTIGVLCVHGVDRKSTRRYHYLYDIVRTQIQGCRIIPLEQRFIPRATKFYQPCIVCWSMFPAIIKC